MKGYTKIFMNQLERSVEPGHTLVRLDICFGLPMTNQAKSLRFTSLNKAMSGEYDPHLVTTH